MIEVVMFGIGFVSGMYILTQIEKSVDKNIHKNIDGVSPIDMSRKIVEILSEDEHVKKYLHTAICHGLESDEINKLHLNVNKCCCLCKERLDEEKTVDDEIYYSGGNNAEPIKKGQCCNKCNMEKVLPLRMVEWGGERGTHA